MSVPSTADARVRHGLVDMLRGLALFGILVVNLEFIASPPFEGWYAFEDPLDQAARWATVTFFQLKSYIVFSLLFGYGLAIMASRATEGLGPRYLRRMLVLAILGILHAVFFYAGDILVTYALLGTLLFPMRNWSTRRLIRIAAWVYGIGLLVVIGVAALVASAPLDDPVQGARTDVYLDGSFLEVAAQRIEDAPIVAIGGLLLQYPSIMAAFLVGVVVGRGDLLSAPGRHAATARQVMWWCLPIGFGLSGVAGVAALTADADGLGPGPALAIVLQTVSGPIAVAGVVAAVVVLSGRSWWPRVERPLIPAGRSSLSVYLGESIVASLVFAGYGLGLSGVVGPAGALAFAAAIFAVLAGAAALWLTRFRQGPFEWLLRSATYWRLQPLRRSSHRPR